MNVFEISIKKIKKSKFFKRNHNEQQLQYGCLSLMKHGQYQPIVISGNEILCGNLIYDCAKKLGMKKVWVCDLGQISEEKKREIRFIDNHTFQTSTWKDQKLKQFLMMLETSRLQDFCFDEEYVFSYVNDLNDEDLIKQVKQKKEQVYYCQKCGWSGEL